MWWRSGQRVMTKTIPKIEGLLLAVRWPPSSLLLCKEATNCQRVEEEVTELIRFSIMSADLMLSTSMAAAVPLC